MVYMQRCLTLRLNIIDKEIPTIVDSLVGKLYFSGVQLGQLPAHLHPVQPQVHLPDCLSLIIVRIASTTAIRSNVPIMIVAKLLRIKANILEASSVL